MTQKDLDKTIKHFRKYSDMDFYEFLKEPEKAKWYSHKVEDFHIIIFDSGEVYQAGTEADTIGIELKTFEDLKIRYKSFIGEEI